MKDRAARGSANNHCVHQSPHPSSYTASPRMRDASLNQLPRPSRVGDRIRQNHNRCREQSGHPSDSRQLAVDRQSGWSFHHALIDAQKPEWGKPACRPCVAREQARHHGRKHSEQEQKHQQPCNRKSLHHEREPTKPPLAKHRQHDAFQGQDEQCGKQPAARNGQQMASQKTRQARRLNRRRKCNGCQDVGIEQETTQQNRNRCHPRQKRPPVRYRQRFENKDVEQVREKQLPLKDRHDAHDDERIHREEEVLIHLNPIRWWTVNPDEMMASHNQREGVVVGPKIDRDHE